MNVKLDYAQRRRANELVEWVIDNPDDAAYELIGLRDALAAQPATVRQTLCEKCGRAINSSTHSYSDLGGYECYSPTTGDELLRKQIAAALNKSMNPGAVNRAMEDVWPVFEAYFNSLPYFVSEKNPMDMLPAPAPATSAEPLRTEIIREIELEREAQDVKWGGPEHDDDHSREDWCEFIADHGQPFRSRPWNFREQMIRVAALAVAAIESDTRAALRQPGTPAEEKK